MIVCGGGPAGIGAALAAARNGAKTRLIEVNGCLGGVWTAGLLSWLFEMDQPGATREITRELDQRGARRNICSHSTDKYAYDVEAMKLLLEELLTSAGVEFHLHSRVVAATRTGARLRSLITESQSGREAWTAHTFIDASGDGDLSALAGCGYDLGKPETGALQPFTFMALVTAAKIEELRPFIVFTDGFAHSGFVEPTRRFCEEIQRAGVDPSYHASTLFHLRDNLCALMINHEYDVSPLNERDVTKATVRGRAEVHRVIEALRALGGPWRELLLSPRRNKSAPAKVAASTGATRSLPMICASARAIRMRSAGSATGSTYIPPTPRKAGDLRRNHSRPSTTTSPIALSSRATATTCSWRGAASAAIFYHTQATA